MFENYGRKTPSSETIQNIRTSVIEFKSHKESYRALAFN